MLTALAASIEAADPDLEAVVNGDVLYTNGSITDVVDSDPGLGVGPDLEYLVPYDLELSFELHGITSKQLHAFGSSAFGAIRLATPQGRLRSLALGSLTWSQSADATTVGVASIFTWSISGVDLATPTSLTGLSLPPQPRALFGSGSMRLCLLMPCTGAGTQMPIPLIGLGSNQVVTTTGLFGTVTVTHAPFTFSTALPSSLGPTTPVVGFMHGPLSNTSTAGRNGGALQLVAPTGVSSTLEGDFGIITRLTITLPEPTSPLLLGAGVCLLIALSERRRRR